MGALQKRRLLLVIDGLERWLNSWSEGSTDVATEELSDNRSGHFEGLDDFLRQCTGLSNGSHLILTTRAMPAAVEGQSFALVPVYGKDAEGVLRGLESVDSEQLLRRFGVLGSSEQIRDLAEHFAHHPLARTVLGALLRDAYGGDAAKWPLASAKGLAPRRALHELLTVTRQHLPGRPFADQFLQVAAHAEENPSLEVIAAGMNGFESSPSKTGEDLRELAVTLGKWQLLRWEPPKAVVSLHPLIKHYFAGLVPTDQSLAIHRRMAEWYDAQALPPNPSSVEHVRCRILAILHRSRCGENARRFPSSATH